MKNQLTPSKVIKRTTHKVIANFTNGFAQNVIQLDNGMILFINYSGDQVEILETEPLDVENDPMAIPRLVNSLPADE